MHANIHCVWTQVFLIPGELEQRFGLPDARRLIVQHSPHEKYSTETMIVRGNERFSTIFSPFSY